MKKYQIKAGVSAVVLGVLSPLAMVLPASAANFTWDGHKEGYGDNYVSSDYNWEGDVAPSSGDAWYFPGSGVSQTVDIDTVDVSSDIDVAGIYFSGSYTGSSEKSYTLMDYGVELLGNIEATMTGNGGNHAVAVDVTLKADSTFKTSGSNTLTVGDTDTTLDIGTHKLTLTGDGGTLTVQGKIKGSGDITSSGKVKFMATPADSGYTGSTTVSSGVLDANGELGNVTLSGGTLKGTGTVGDVTMSSGTVAPGNSPGVLNTGSLAYTGGSFDVELGGTGSGEFDQTAVTGSVDLGSATDLNISLYGSFAPALKDSFTIISNDGTDAVSGTFKGLKEGEKVYGTYTYQVSYKGGDGNDVTLTVTGTPAAPDTGTGSVMSNPLATLIAAILVAGTVAGYRFYEVKKSK